MSSENSSVQIMNWFFGQVCVPVTFVVVAMAIIYFSHQDLVSTLADGELLLVGTLLSLGLFGEMMFTDSRPGRPLLLVSFFLCILFVIAYVWLKTQLVNYDPHAPGALPSHVQTCAVLSFFIGAIGIAWSILGYVIFVKQAATDKSSSNKK